MINVNVPCPLPAIIFCTATAATTADLGRNASATLLALSLIAALFTARALDRDPRSSARMGRTT